MPTHERNPAAAPPPTFPAGYRPTPPPPPKGHAPRPGPLYWDWRCMTCDRPVADHPSWWRRLLGKRHNDGQADG